MWPKKLTNTVKAAQDRRAYDEAAERFNEATAAFRLSEGELHAQRVAADLVLAGPDERGATSSLIAREQAGRHLRTALRQPAQFRLEREQEEAKNEIVRRDLGEARAALQLAADAESKRLFLEFRPRHRVLLRQQVEVVRRLSELVYEERELVSELGAALPRTGGLIPGGNIMLPVLSDILGIGDLSQPNSRSALFIEFAKKMGAL